MVQFEPSPNQLLNAIEGRWVSDGRSTVQTPAQIEEGWAWDESDSSVEFIPGFNPFNLPRILPDVAESNWQGRDDFAERKVMGSTRSLKWGASIGFSWDAAPPINWSRCLRGIWNHPTGESECSIELAA